MLASAVIDTLLGPPRLSRHSWPCPCISVVPEATHEASQGLEMETTKLPEREWCFLDEGSWICPLGKSMLFYKKETEKN